MKRYVKFIALIMACIIAVLSFSACSIKINFPKKEEETETIPHGELETEADDPLTVSVTIPEGYTILQIAKKLEDNKVCSKDEFLELCKKPVDGITIEKNAKDRYYLLEGYLFPDTYEFYTNTTAEIALSKFIENYKSKVTSDMEARAKELGYTMDEMLTLASMIQKECDKDPAECANVSAVFHNRLKSSDFPTLGSDVTTFYVTQNLGELLDYQDGVKLEKQNNDVKKYMDLYSTYYCKGLPIGPICNPGIKAITAALNPADTSYYYFLTDESGEDFYYAKTMDEHNANGRKAGLF